MTVTEPFVVALACGAPDDLTGDLCRVIGPHEQHAYDGVDPWTPTSDTRETA